MKREFLQDRDQKEQAAFQKLEKCILEGKFSFSKDRYPPNDRFVNLQNPVAVVVGTDTVKWNAIWSQIPFSGSLILLIQPCSKKAFETVFFKVSEIPSVIDFIKETGRLQIALNREPLAYEGLDYMDPFFTELNPPYYHMAPSSIFVVERKFQEYVNMFDTLASVKFKRIMKRSMSKIDPFLYEGTLIQFAVTYALLKAGGYAVAEDVENLMIDDPESAFILFCACRDFIIDPLTDLRSDLRNCGMQSARMAQMLPSLYRPQPQFPCEIGKFLVKKLTYAAQDIRACYELMDHYDANDLRKVQQALNDGIVTSHPDIVTKSTGELSQILDNVWNDKTIPNRIKNLEIGVPVSIAAIGGIVAGLPGAFAGGFLSELGFRVVEKATEKYAEKLFNVKEERLTERLAKLRTQSYQANIYDFKKKYNK